MPSAVGAAPECFQNPDLLATRQTCTMNAEANEYVSRERQCLRSLLMILHS
jgi:hypothetical protein